MKRIKIVYLVGTLEIGGTEQQLIELFRNIDRSQFDIHVLAFECIGPLRTEIEALGIPFVCLNVEELQGKFHPSSYVRIYQLLRNMVRFLKQERPHIVQTYLFWTNVYGSMAAKLSGVPIILTGRRALMEVRYKVFHRQWLQNCSNWCATAILANSQAVKEECLQRDQGVNAEKIEVIYNGINAESFRAAHDRLRLGKEFRIPDSSLVIGIVATLHPRKRHKDLLQALTMVQHRYPQTLLVCVGRDGGMREALEALAGELGIRESVRFVGERRDIPEILNLFDMLVLPSEVEGLSNVVLEGMAAGLPVISADIAGNSELVLHERTGLLVPPRQPRRLAEAILRLLDSAALRKQFGEAGRQRVEEHFRLERMVSRTEELYRKLVTMYGQGSATDAATAA